MSNRPRLFLPRYSIFRYPLTIGLCLVFAWILFKESRPVQAETTVVFLSDSFEGVLVPVNGGGYETEKAIEVIVQNKGESAVNVSFCVIPDGENLCPAQDVRVAIDDDEANLLADGRFKLESDQIKPLKLTLRFPAPPQQVVAPVPPPADETSLGRFLRTELEDIKSFWDEGLLFVENKQPETKKGWLLLLADNDHAAGIRYTLTPKASSLYILDQMTAEVVIVSAAILSLLSLLRSILPFLRQWTWLKRLFPGFYQTHLDAGALWTLPMGKAEWKLEDSWVVNLSVAITILGGIQGILPDSLEEFKNSYAGLIFLFGVITATAAFVYNAFTQPGPEKEEGKETYKKQGRTLFFLLTSFFVIWSLLAQFGLQVMALERLRDSQSDIPGGFLLLLELGVYLMTGVVIVSTIKTLPQTILEQKIDAHKKAHKQNKTYLTMVIRIRRYAAQWMGRMDVQENLPEHDIQHIREKFAEIVPREVPVELSAEEEFRNLYSHFMELFHVNLPALLRSVANDQNAARELFRAIMEDAKEAEKFLNQTLPVEEVVAAFYSSLWAPREVRKKSYQEALTKIGRHLQVACAQASSTIEPDRVIGPNEELHTSIKVTLAALDKALGLAGKRDPIYTNLEKLVENAKQRWDVMKINELKTALCRLSTVLEKCNEKLEAYFEKKENSEQDTLGGNLAMIVLQPLATALRDNIFYPKPFPIDTKALEKEYNDKPSMAAAKRELAKIKAARPKRKTGKEKQAEPEKTTELLVKQELQNLQKSINAIQISPYSASDTEFQQNRIKALRQSSQEKVLGEDVSLL